MQMEIKQEEQKKKGSFFIDEEGERVAELQYFHSAEGQITIYHTEVDEKLRGKGIGEDLVGRAVEFAREKGLKIVATCPYAHKVIMKTPAYKDVLY
jgi:uncharacterized protein